MNVIIRNAKIVDAGNPFHNKVVDVKIDNGIIHSIDKDLPTDNRFEEFSGDGLHISEGWFDSSVSFGEPGFEERETIDNGLDVAAKSGFTDIALQPNCSPVTDNQSQVKFLRSKAFGHAVNLYPIGTLTKNADGIDLAELYDMKNAGAIAFGDYNRNISNSNLLKIALQYADDFNGLVIAFAQDKDISGTGVVNEGIPAMRLGLKGIPMLAEELIVARNLFLLEYTGGRMHIPTISTARSASLIKAAKQKGLQVTCSVAVHHLVLTDEELSGFDTRFKVRPPLRDESTRQALIDAVKDGTIDMITSDHNPIDIEHKKVEFDSAMYGTIGLESAFPALMKVLPPDIIVEKLTARKSIFGIEGCKIEVGAKASLTIFQLEGKRTFEMPDILSKSKNCAFLGKTVIGNVLGIYSNSQLLIK